MAKEEILLREEMGRLEIEPVHNKTLKSRNDENPFVDSSSETRTYLKRALVQNKKCPCLQPSKRKISGVCKKKQNKIIKDPVLKLVSRDIHTSLLDREWHSCKEKNMCSSKEGNSDSLNLCALVQNCHQLKISSGCRDKAMMNSEKANEVNWWKSDSLIIHKKDPRQNTQPGSCSQQALNPPCDVTIDELASYFETLVHIPKKMSSMAEMMYI